MLCCCQQLLQKICIVFFKEKSNERNELTPCMIERWKSWSWLVPDRWLPLCHKGCFFKKTNIHFQYYVIMLFVGSKFTIFEGDYSTIFNILSVRVSRETYNYTSMYLFKRNCLDVVCSLFFVAFHKNIDRITEVFR